MSKTKPEFCTIAPTNYLNKYARFNGSKFHLLLAHIADPQSTYYDKQYADFYRDTKQPGETYIIDNGAFELGESYDPERLIETAKSVGADIAVLPDYPGQPFQKTIDAANTYIPMFKTAGLKTFFVPQSEPGDWDGWVRSFAWGLNQSDIDVIGMSILAHPIALPVYPKGYVRVVAADRIKQLLSSNPQLAKQYSEKHIHWLGLLSPGLEVEPLLAMGLVDTLDSSGPVWYGHCGIQYNQFGESWAAVEKKYVPEVDFSAHVNKNAHRVIEHNLRILQNVFDKYNLEA